MVSEYYAAQHALGYLHLGSNMGIELKNTSFAKFLLIEGVFWTNIFYVASSDAKSQVVERSERL